MFGLFVVAIGCDQMQAVLHDETAVEHIQRKGPRKAKRPKLSLLGDVFGNGKSASDQWSSGSGVWPRTRRPWV
jgi:hypothetical protein